MKKPIARKNLVFFSFFPFCTNFSTLAQQITIQCDKGAFTPRALFINVYKYYRKKKAKFAKNLSFLLFTFCATSIIIACGVLN